MRNWLLGSSAAAAVSILVLSSCIESLKDDCRNSLSCKDSSIGTAGAGGNAGESGGGTAGAGGNASGASGGEGSGGKTGGTGGALNVCEPKCSGDKPVCDQGDCVECLKDSDCKSGAEDSCDTENKTCVECKESSDCDGADASKCDVGECTQCEENDDCAHIAGKGVCDEGTCVACVSEADCNGNVCDRDVRTCTDLPAHQLNACETCEHDAQCQVGQVCVEMKYSDPAEAVVGNFCLWRKDAPLPGPNGACGGSFKPFAQSAAITSVDGVATTVCRLATTTCPALLQHRTSVTGCTTAFTDDAACGAPGFADGRCRLNSEDEPKCSYPCLGNEDCQSGSTCPSTGDRYCSL